jgi:integrase
MITSEKTRTWESTNVAGLYVHKSGRFYYRTKVQGKQIWEPLKTTVKSVAESRLAEKSKAVRSFRQSTKGGTLGKLTVGQALVNALEAVDQNAEIAPNTKRGRREGAKALLASWPELDKLDVRKLTTFDVRQWSNRVRNVTSAHVPFKAKSAMRNSKGCSTSKHNGMLDILRMALDYAVHSGAAFSNVARDRTIQRPAQKPKALTLPDCEDFPKLVAAMRDIGGNAKHAADLVELLAYSWARINEVRHLLWSDVDFSRNQIRLRVTKNGDPRTVAMMPELTALLLRMQEEQSPVEPTATVTRVFEAQKSLNSAAEKAGVHRLTHHDLRHLFATTCIEAGIDIPTVARLLGHKDGGALAMKTYGHLRDEHAQRMIQKVRFAAPESKAVRTPLKKGVRVLRRGSRVLPVQ